MKLHKKTHAVCKYLNDLPEIKNNSWKFDHICEIIPETDEKGIPTEFFPQKRYNNKKNLSLNRYGKGPFCKFNIDEKFCGKSGVYTISINNKIQYVGQCKDIHGRFNNGYGNISPRNCFERGQSTNCRVNSEILKSYKSYDEIQLCFFETKDRYNIECLLICHLEPLWNKTRRRLSKI